MSTKKNTTAKAKAKANETTNAETTAEAKAKGKVKAEAKAEAKAKGKGKTEAKPEAKAEAEAKGTAEAEAKGKEKDKGKLEGKAKDKGKKAEAEAKAKDKGRPEDKAKTVAKAGATVRPDGGTTGGDPRTPHGQSGAEGGNTRAQKGKAKTEAKGKKADETAKAKTPEIGGVDLVEKWPAGDPEEETKLEEGAYLKWTFAKGANCRQMTCTNPNGRMVTAWTWRGGFETEVSIAIDGRRAFHGWLDKVVLGDAMMERGLHALMKRIAFGRKHMNKTEG